MATNQRRFRSVPVAILAVVFVVATALPANAADWVLVDAGDTASFYLDREYEICTYCYDRDTVYLQWEKVVPRKGKTAAWRQELRSSYGKSWTSKASRSLSLTAYDCSTGEFAWAGRVFFYDSRGRVVHGIDDVVYEEFNFRATVPGTIGESMLEAVCQFSE